MLDRERLEQAAGVGFHDDTEAKQLVDLVKDWSEVRSVRRSDRLQALLKLRKQARSLGAELTDFELLRYDDSPTRNVTDRRWQQHALEVTVAAVVEVWREHKGKGSTGSYYRDLKSQHDGPLIRLLLELFEQAGVPQKDRPGRHTLHNAIVAASAPAPTT